jgi:hypothetical protein
VEVEVVVERQVVQIELYNLTTMVILAAQVILLLIKH